MLLGSLDRLTPGSPAVIDTLTAKEWTTGASRPLYCVLTTQYSPDSASVTPLNDKLLELFPRETDSRSLTFRGEVSFSHKKRSAPSCGGRGGREGEREGGEREGMGSE